ncbi:MAG: phage tail sheath subtilisin-like domain-containing protein [Euryarchaeota archaeon]|nr:phage tail sheath subtilisin-like domain-containing protein [Euryarchaeota archaeon]MBU4139053.1 phage tail sheath subtilisin-like domain-containing protein [Euryarchaeota archaeon]
MTEYLSPGVYVEEKSSGAKPIEGVGTSTGAFVGIAEKGPIGEAKQIANWTQFVNTFGAYIANGYLAYAVYQFFSEGGTRCFVVRTCHYTDITDPVKKTALASSGTMNDDADAASIKAMAVWEGTWGDKISVEAKDATDTTLTNGFKLVVKYGGVEKESFDNLTMDTIEDAIDNISAYIKVDKQGLNPNPPKKATPLTLASGNDGLSDISETDFEGDGKALNGLHAFDVVDDINIVLMPDMSGNRDAIIKGMTYCQNRKDCFFIADPPKSLDPTAIKSFKEGTGTYKGNAFNSSYGALYYPWVIVSDPLNPKKKKYVPPSGAIAGSYAHTDSVRGVHKAPAGISDGYLDSVSDIERIITKSEHDGLNPVGINVIRSFPTSGIVIWGARTLSADPEWKYINIRRLFLFLEESIDKGTQWLVFEPNSPALWGSVIRNITAFLLRVWRDGALFGSTPEEAFYVKVDAENNPPEVRDAGQLIIEVGVAPVKPAEFVIIRIQQKTLSK